MRRGEPLGLHVHIAVPGQLQHLRKEGKGLSVPDPGLAGLCGCHLGDRAKSWDIRIVVNHNATIRRSMSVELDAISVEYHRPPERGA